MLAAVLYAEMHEGGVSGVGLVSSRRACGPRRFAAFACSVRGG